MDQAREAMAAHEGSDRGYLRITYNGGSLVLKMISLLSTQSTQLDRRGRQARKEDTFVFRAIRRQGPMGCRNISPPTPRLNPAGSSVFARFASFAVRYPG